MNFAISSSVGRLAYKDVADTKRLMVVAVEEGRLQRGVHLTEIAIFASGSGSVWPLSRDVSDSSIRFNFNLFSRRPRARKMCDVTGGGR